MTNAIQKPQAGTLARSEFGAQSIQTMGETASNVLAARAKAEVEARFIVAMQRPRDWDTVRTSLLKEIERPGFADVAWYQIPNRGEGFTIRFAEAALRSMRNIDSKTDIIFEDDDKRIISVTVMDIENNISLPATISIGKTIERKYLNNGEVAIGQRVNSSGETVYIRACTDDELLTKTNSAVSKAMRNGLLRLLPGDIQSDCARRIYAIKQGDAAKDPNGYKKKVLDGFADLNISPENLTRFLKHEVGTSSPEELVMLRDIYSAIRDGRATWHDIAGNDEDSENQTPMERLTEALKKKKGKENDADSDKKPEVAHDPESGEVGYVVELKGLATDKYGNKGMAWIENQAKCDLNKIDEKTASRLIDVLNEEKEKSNAKK